MKPKSAQIFEQMVQPWGLDFAGALGRDGWDYTATGTALHYEMFLLGWRAGVTAQSTERDKQPSDPDVSWRHNPDKMGGAFTAEEIQNATAWR